MGGGCQWIGVKTTMNSSQAMRSYDWNPTSVCQTLVENTGKLFEVP